MSVGLSGNLVDFGIADVFQLIGQQRKTGILELKNPSSRAQLVFDQGLIVSAAPAVGRATDIDPLADMLVRCGLLTRERADEAVADCRASARTLTQILIERCWLEPDAIVRAEELLTRDTIFEVLRWQTGSFDFRGEEVAHDRDRARLLGAEQILMDGLRMLDEWQSFEELVPSDGSVFQRVGRFDTYLSEAERTGRADLEQAERVLSLIDGRLTVRRVVDLSMLGTFDGMRILADLCRADVIKPLNPEGVRHLRRHTRQGADRGAVLKRAIAALVPLALLSGVVWWIHLGPAPEAPDTGYRIERTSLESVREAHEARRVRNAIETFRLTEGRWPARLEELADSGILPADALAAPQGRPYYSNHTETGLVFLAPER